MIFKPYRYFTACIISWIFCVTLQAGNPHQPEISFCAGGWGDDYMYYNLFAQENMEEPQYKAFLLSYDNRFYDSEKDLLPRTDENIEDWKDYLQLSYEETEYLVLKADRHDLRALVKGNSVEDDRLAFADGNFTKKHKQALLYLAYAKYLAPYMAVKGDRRYSWGNAPEHHAGELDYDEVINVLEKSWHAETDKDLRIRYGYQLVRLAHYSGHYPEAIAYFNDYVESLHHKPIMYYYALDQKGGAERALGNFMQAHHDFFRFFTHTRNRKEQAYTSMLVTRDLDFEKLLAEAGTTNEKNDLYMLLGYRDFNNPLSSIRKILENDPNAPQAKVLMVRAVNQLERNYFPVSYNCPYNHPDCLKDRDNYRIPLNRYHNDNTFLEETLRISESQSENPEIKEQEFWKLTTAWLYFIQGDYDRAGLTLESITPGNKRFDAQKDKLSMLITISEQETITPGFEKQLMKRFGHIFREDPEKDPYSPDMGSTGNFVIDILANRYFLQEDYAKGFLLQNDISELEAYPQLQLLEAIEKFYHKKNKNEFEHFLAENLAPEVYDDSLRKMIRQRDFDIKSYIANMKGNIYLRQGEPEKAAPFFDEVDRDFYGFKGFSGIPSDVFGYNRMECFECPDNMVMQTDYIGDFDMIGPSMNKKELTRALIRLEQEAAGRGDKAARAGYLLGNFYFNTSLIGYYRQFLTFSNSNGKSYKFHNYFSWNEQFDRTAPEYLLYFKNYGWTSWYYDDFEIALSYLNRALEQTADEELKARILFAASKCEQGIFYSIRTDKELNNLKNMDYNKRKAARIDIKTSRYRSYFKKLKAYEHTGFYREVKTYCKYFDYYVTHY